MKLRLRRQTVNVSLVFPTGVVAEFVYRAWTRSGAKRKAGEKIIENTHRSDVDVEILQHPKLGFGIPFVWNWFPRSPHQQHLFEGVAP